ncbi:MAG TPA: hypothetical protein EYN66_20975, partial [Myxococcales bacterium]|nr:hypothetical protein [Myxococcales bacterium]
MPDCNDTNECTTDSCHSALGCQNDPMANGTSCGDTNACNGTESCQGGKCTLGSPLTCGDSNPCTNDSCDPKSGCVNTAVSNGTACSDNNACNGKEACQSGKCSAGTPPDCNDSNACTSDSCSPATGCNNTPVGNGTNCSDNNVCNGAETCQSGSCAKGTPLTCDDGNTCTSDSCDATTGCQFQAVAANTPCSDGNVCNGKETCQAGSCTQGTPQDCNDGNACTTDSCNSLSGCQNQPALNGTPCPDANLCNGNETCQSGKCAAGITIKCDDGKQCTLDACDPKLGCTNKEAVNDTPCPDATLCNGNELCQNGTCAAGVPPNCDDKNPCTANVCNATTGCGSTNLANGSACPDNDLCNGNEQCKNGVCQSTAAPDCDDSNVCTVDSCDPILGCQNPAACCKVCVTGQPCGNSCININLNCSQPPGCACSADVGIVSANVKCSDGNACNGLEKCIIGVCQAGAALLCDDKNVCTADSCDPLSGCVST